MEHFASALTVRLRSHHRTFLSADDDDEGAVRQDRNGTARSSRWTVELVPSGLVRLRSCHGRYLSASEQRCRSLPGAGRKVLLLAVPPSTSVDATPSLQWRPLLEGERVRLQSYLGTFLRANGLIMPYKGSVTHGDPKRTLTQEFVYWEVDVLAMRAPLAAKTMELDRGEGLMSPPVKPLRTAVSAVAKSSWDSAESSPSVAAKTRLPPRRVEEREVSPQRQGSPRTPPTRRPAAQRSREGDESGSPVMAARPLPRGRKEEVEEAGSVDCGSEYPSCEELGSTSSSPENSPARPAPRPPLLRDHSLAEGRVIHYYVVDDEGEVDYRYPGEPFTFKGSSVKELTRQVEQMTGRDGLILCIRDVINYDRLRRLQLHLPPNRQSMVVLAVPSSSPVAKTL